MLLARNAEIPEAQRDLSYKRHEGSQSCRRAVLEAMPSVKEDCIQLVGSVPSLNKLRQIVSSYACMFVSREACDLYPSLNLTIRISSIVEEFGLRAWLDEQRAGMKGFDPRPVAASIAQTQMLALCLPGAEPC